MPFPGFLGKTEAKRGRGRLPRGRAGWLKSLAVALVSVGQGCPAVIGRGERQAVAEPEGQPAAWCWRLPFRAPTIAKISRLVNSGEGWP